MVKIIMTNIELLLDAIDDNDIDYIRESLGNIPNNLTDDVELHRCIFYAIDSREPEIVKIFLEQGCPVNIEDESGYSLLYTAIDDGYDEIVQLLIEAGVNVNGLTGSSCRTPLGTAVDYDDLNCVKLLLEAGANINTVLLNAISNLNRSLHTTPDRDTEEIKNNQRQIIKLLLQYSADFLLSNEDATFLKLLARGCENDIENILFPIGKLTKAAR